MPLFYVAVREHTYTGRFHSEAVQAASPEEALHVAAGHAAVPRPPPALTPQQVSDLAATGRTPAERLDTDVVQAPRRQDTPQVAAALRPPPGPVPQGYSVVVSEQAGAVPAYSEVVQAASVEDALQIVPTTGEAVRDDRGIAHAAPGPAAPVPSSITQPSPSGNRSIPRRRSPEPAHRVAGQQRRHRASARSRAGPSPTGPVPRGPPG